MNYKSRPRKQHVTTFALLIVAVLLGALIISVSRSFSLVANSALAASPASGTISPASPITSYTGGPFDGINQTNQVDSAAIVCSPASPCDDYALTISNLDPTITYKFRVRVSWTDKPTATSSHNDFDLYVYDANGSVVQSSATSANPETTEVTVKTSTYKIRVLPFDVNTGPGGDTYGATVTLFPLAGAPPIPTPPPTVPGVPRYQNYAAPNGLGTTAGEPSIGVDWATDKAFISSNLQTLRVTFDDCSSPAKATWEDKSADTSQESLDPILFTDHNGLAKDRTFVSQLTGQDSLTSFTDDDGESYTPSQGGGIPSGVDHQSIGGGPYRTDSTAIPPVLPPPHPLYPNVIYYCSQEAATAFCARSDNGGLTFGPGVPIYTINDCAGIHGHVKVTPDGTVYVPNKSCGGKQGLVRSRDNGITWTVLQNPGSTATSKLVDPSVGIGKNNTAYFAYQSGVDSSGNFPPRVAVMRTAANGTVTWSNDQLLGTEFGIKNSTFPEAISSAFNPAAVAADDNRAAVAFLGTTAAGDYTNTSFSGTWHLFIATTFDGGVTWKTVDATPNDPVQRGSICNLGTTACVNTPDDRNLLDFNDMTIDSKGRVLVGYADGCVGSCVNGTENSFTELASIARQSGGRRIISAFDPVEPTLPGAPVVTAFSDANGIHLSWQEPDNGGSPITGYKVYRRPDGTAQKTLLANVGTSTTFDDLSAVPGVKYFYSVSAVNAVGEGPTCGEVTPVALPPVDPCNLPGVSLVQDPAGDAAPPVPALDLRELFIAEPFDPATPNTNKLVWTMKVNSLAVIPTSSQWYIIWDFGRGLRRYVAMKTDSAGARSFEWGHIGPPLSPTNPDPDANKPFKDGDDPNFITGVVDQANGAIRITIANSKVSDTSNASNVPKAGSTLANISPRTFNGSGNTNVTGSSATDSTVNTPSYTLIGNRFCRPQTAPVAQLNASPTLGPPPLTVNFNGFGSFDPDSGDSIASYTFDFGDTNVITQSSPTISNTYTSNGVYQAKLFVRDTRGKLSANPATVTITVSNAAPTPSPSPVTPTTVQFSGTTVGVTEGCTSIPVTLTRTGPATGISTVDYTVNNGTATQRGDFTYATGTVVFAANETSKTFPVLISEDGYAEGTETATISLSNATGATIGSPDTASLQISDNDFLAVEINPIDDAATFVGQHYHDFLNRQSDSPGQTFWTDQISSCGNNASCLDEKRTNVSAAFFLSIEFQNTGYFAFRFYRASFPDSAQRPRGVPRYLEFLRDEQMLQRNVVVGQPNWEAVLEQNEVGFALDWVARADFIAEYPTSLTRDQFIDQAFARSAATPTQQELTLARGAYDSGFSLKEKRAFGLRKVVETGSVYNAQYNPAFVLMQYFGYLRRNPNNAPDNNFSGYDFWLNKMNQFSLPGEDARDANVALARVRRAEMVKAFIVSGEYRGRFGGDSTRGQQFGSVALARPALDWRQDALASLLWLAGLV